jgi:16S rRNA (cytosine967-C5)-methyltransferase
MARHPDARWRLSPDHIQQLARLQTDILDGSAPIVRPNGLLVYVTCSLEAEENDEQVERFLEQHPEYTRAGEDLYIFPPDAGTDGGFAARLRRAT